MNILVIGTQNSIHDFKWMRHIANRFGGKIYFIGEAQNQSQTDIEKYAAQGIKLLAPLPAFSLSAPWRSLSALFRVKRIISENKMDAVHVIFPTPHLFWLSLSTVPTVVSTRGSDVLVVMKELAQKQGIKNKILYALLKSNLRKIKAITSTSELQKEFLEHEFPFLSGKTSIVRTGVDVELIHSIQPKNKTEGKKIIFSPRFFLPIYNIVGQIKAIKQLPADLQKQLKTIFIRGKIYDETYEKEILKELEGVDFSYEIREFMGLEDMVRQYKNSDLVIMTPFSDGTPNSAVEAMLCKVPLIMSDLPYNSPLFENNSLRANPKDEKDISEKIKTALENYPQEKIEKAYQAVLRHGNQSVEMQKIIDLYHRFGVKKQ